MVWFNIFFFRCGKFDRYEDALLMHRFSELSRKCGWEKLSYKRQWRVLGALFQFCSHKRLGTNRHKPSLMLYLLIIPCFAKYVQAASAATAA